MKPTSTSRRIGHAMLAAIALPCLTSDALAQLAPAGTPGDRAVYTIGSGLTLGTGFGTTVVHDFVTTAVPDTADSFDPQVGGAVDLTGGHHIVIYGTRYSNGASSRAALDNTIRVNGATTLPYGAAASYSRDNTNNNNFVRGGTIVEVGQGDSIEIVSQRIDNHSQTITQQDADLQLVKLDDTLDYLRLGVSADLANLMSNAQAGPAAVSYDVQDELDGGFLHTSGSSQITLNEVGHYLVFANTGVRISGSNRHRQAITQRLTLDGTPVEDSATVMYLRYAGSGDGAGGLVEFGATSLGMIVRTTAPASVLEVEVLRDNLPSGTNTAVALEANRTGLAILKLPSYGEYITLSGPSQNINFAQGNPETPLTLSDVSPVSNASFDYDSGASATQVTVNKAGDYLFLASHFIDDFDTPGTDLRTIARQGFQTIPSGGSAGKIAYGNGGAYNRDRAPADGQRARDSGDWAGAILPLSAGDAVETTTARFGGNPTSLTANSIGLQALNIGSISTAPLNPVVSLSGPLNVLVSSVGTIVTDESHLLTADANTGPADLIYTITSAITGGTLRLSGAPLAMNGTFTQEDVNNDLLTFDAAASVQVGGFDFSVSDGGPNPASRTFTINVGVSMLLADDSGVTNEDTVLSAVDPGGAQASLLTNDTGTLLRVTTFDAVSAMGATVSVASDGTFTYDPTGSTTLQALAVGEQAADSFTYTVADFLGDSATATVNLLVDGVNDAPVVNSESVTSSNGAGISSNLLSNESDTDASDVLTVTSFTQQVFGNGGPVPNETFNFQSVPFVFETNLGATVRISADGTFVYDASSSATLLGLTPGVTISETFDYVVSDGTVMTPTTIAITSAGSALPTNDYATTDAGTPVNIAILANDQVRNNPGAPGAPTPGAVLDLNAADAGNTDSNWGNSGAGGGALVMEGAGTESVLIVPANAPIGVTAAYRLSGTGSGDQILSTDDAGNLYGSNISTADATIEVVFRPDDQVGDEPIWGSGGNGTGTSLVLLGNQVVLTVGQNAIAAQARGTIPPGAIAGGEYVHVIGIIDLVNDVVELYINNVLVDRFTAVDFSTGGAGNLTDWSGTDDEGIGRSAGTTGGDINVAPFLGNFGTIDIPDFNDATQRYAGELAILRVYTGAPLNPVEREANFEAVFGAASPAVPGDLTSVAGGAPSIGVPVGLPSGATVTLLGDGSVDYDPNGMFDHVGVGLSDRDSFAYTLNTTGNDTVTVNIDVTGTNTDPQVTIASVQAGVGEGSPASFTVTASAPVSGPVDVTVSFSGLAAPPADFTGPTTVQIPNGGTSAQLVLNVLNDNLFEGLENIIVTIESASGNAVVGGTSAAETLVTDAQSAPEFTIVADQASAAEGTAAGFTVAASIPSQEDRTLTVSYSGTALNEIDFFGPFTVVVPGGSAGTTLEIVPLDDGLPEGTESLTVTLESVDTGTIGAPASATTDVTDGSAALLFFADFEGINPADTPGGTLLNTDAPFAADLGTIRGSWSGIFTIASGGDAPGVITEGDDVKGDGVDSALRLDRPGPGDGDIFALFTAPADISGANTASVLLDLATRRTQNNSTDKSYSIIGLDDLDRKSFELFVDANNNGTAREQLFHVDSAGVRTPIGNTEDFNNSGNYNESRMSRVFLSLTSSGYTVRVDRFPIDGMYDSVTADLPYAGPAEQISKIHFELSGSTDTNVNSGMFLDDFFVSGVAGNIAPTATLNGAPLANGGFSVLPDRFIGTGAMLDTIRVDDPDAGAGSVTAAFQSNGTAPLTFSAGGPANVSGNGTGVLVLTGTLANVNASLAAGVTITTDAATGGEATATFLIDDGGNTGAGGAKFISHDLNFFVNEGPTVTIDLAPGQLPSSSVAPIEFEVVFSEAVTGFDGSDIDFSASTETGPLVAAVSGGGDTYTVSVTGMSSGGNVTISVPKGAANATAGGAATEASKAINGSVTFIPPLPPSATNLVQNIGYVVGPVDIADIVVSDPNDSVVTTGQAPQYDFPAVHGDALDLLPDPATDAGFAIDVAFTMSGFDDFGTVRVIEIGGTSNGTGIYLLDGVPHLVSKMASSPAQVPSGLNDTDWSDGNVSIPLAAFPLALDVPARIAVVSSLDAVTFSVNGMGQTTVPLTGRNPALQTDWSGDDTIRSGQNSDAGHGGLGDDPAGIFSDASTFPMEGTMSSARLWHAPDASAYSILALDAPEEITATLNITPGEGDLSVPAGVTYDAGLGLWTITGTLDEVNAALAAVQFLPNGTSPVTVGVTIDDGDEDGSGPLLGSLTFRTGAPVDSDGDDIPDDYEIANGLNPNDPSDATSDGDNDGWDARSEYLMGTAANNRNEVPVFEVTHVSATRVEITYGPILTGRTYEVLASSTGEPLPPAIDSFTAPADAATNTAVDSTGAEASEIYRLQVTVP